MLAPVTEVYKSFWGLDFLLAFVILFSFLKFFLPFFFFFFFCALCFCYLSVSSFGSKDSLLVST